MATVVVFDVNETLLDLDGLAEAFEQAFGVASVHRDWFEGVIHAVLRITATDDYVELSAVAEAVLDDAAEQRGRDLSAEQREAILEGLGQLPAHADARPALEQLREAGFRLAALTNSTGESGRRKLRQAGLASFFEQIFSADDVGRFKPSPEPYQMVAQHFGVEPHELCLVAVHDWDVAGARQAGCQAAFVTRGIHRLGPLVETPEYVGVDLGDVAARLIEAERRAQTGGE